MGRRTKNKKRGRPKKFSNLAIETFIALQQFFRLPLRSTEGLLSDILLKLGSECRSPDYSTVSLRGRDTAINIKVRQSKENVHLVVDSTGVKVYGEGEWKVRKHGWSKHRTWLKVHLGVDESTGDVLIAETTDNSVHDSQMVQSLLNQTDTRIDQFSGDGAYDTRTCYDVLRKRGVKKITVPPRKNAKVWNHGNKKRDRLVRDENLRAIRKVGRKQWKIENGYHRRSLSETAMFRLKTLFGERVSARLFENQKVQILSRLKLLNRMTALGMPESYVVAQIPNSNGISSFDGRNYSTKPNNAVNSYM